MRAASLFFGLAGGLTLAACAGILGIDDRSLDTQSPDGSTGEGGPSGDGSGPGQPDGPSPGDDGSSPASDGGDGGGQSDAASCPDPCTYAKDLDHPFSLTSDANNVYWTEFGDDVYSSNGAVKSCPVGGCPASGPTVIMQGIINPRGLAADGQNVYFGTGGTAFQAGNGGVWTCPLSGCNGSAKQLAAASAPFGVALDATYVYWTDNDDATVHRAAKTGTGGSRVLYDAGDGVVVQPADCVVDTSNVFFTDWNGDLYRLPVGGGSPATMTSWGYGGVWPVVIDSSNVYYGAPGGVFRVAKAVVNSDGGAPLATGIVDPDDLAIDDAGVVYWSSWGSTGNDGTVGKVKGTGGGQATIAASQPSTEAVTVSGGYVFWLTSGTPDAMGNPTSSTGTLVRSTK